jgi:hypothetical protein
MPEDRALEPSSLCPVPLDPFDDDARPLRVATAISGKG